MYPWVRLCVCLLPRWLLQESGDLCLHTPPPPHTGESQSQQGWDYIRSERKQSIIILLPTWQLLKKNNFKAGSALDFLQFSKGEGIGNSVQVRRTQTCARWLMTKLYINVRYDRLHRDGVWNANDAAHQLSVASFDLSHTPEQPLTLSW